MPSNEDIEENIFIIHSFDLRTGMKLRFSCFYMTQRFPICFNVGCNGWFRMKCITEEGGSFLNDESSGRI